MSATYWDTELGKGGSGGEPQQLQLNGFTLSLVPDGGSVQLPVGYVSSIGSVLVISSVLARDSIVVGPNSNVVLTSTGQVIASTLAVSLVNSFNVNATNTTTTNLTNTTANITTLNAATGNIPILNANRISSGMATVSSIKVGGITISKDTGIGNTKVEGDQIWFYQNINQDAPGQNINGRFFNGEILNLTSTLNATSSIALSNAAGNAAMTLNGHTLSNTATNLTYDGQPLQTGTRGDVSQWAQFPANTTVNANGQSITNVNGLYCAGIAAEGATLNNLANIGTNKQDSVVNILTKDGTNTVFAPGTFNVGFSTGNPLSTQPNINLKGNAVNIAAGDLISPAYPAGRTINIDAYAGTSAQLFPPFANANSYINITSHGNSVGAIPVFGKGTGNITLRAFNAYNGLVPDPFSPGTITLDASIVNIGNPTYTGIGTSAIVNMQGAIVQTIAGLQFGGEPGIPAYQIRSAGGVTIYNDPTGFSNRDSRLYVRDIFGHSNFVSDFGPPALTLDGLDGGLTLNNFIVANGQGDGADLNNIATMSGAYPTNVQNQINALQSAITNISTTGGTSSLALWFQYPALSTITLNKDINMSGTAASISSLQGVIFNNTSGILTNTYQKRVYLDGKTPTTGSTMIYYDASSVAFINPGNLAYNNIRGQGFYFGASQSNYLAVSSGVLQFNGQALISTNGSGGGGGGGSLGPNPLVSTLTVAQGGNIRLGSSVNAGTWLQFDKDLAGTNNIQQGVSYNTTAGFGNELQLGLTNQAGYYEPLQLGQIFVYGRTLAETQNATMYIGENTIRNPVGTNNLALSNISTINSIPISSFINGNSGPSSIQNWSYFPVLSNAIQFGNQSAWIKGENNALFTSSNGSNTIPVLAQAFTVFDPNNVGVIRNIGFDSNGVLSVQRTNTHPSDLRVSSIILGTSPLTTDGTDLFLNGTNIGSGNTAQWANYPAINTVRGTTLEFSNASPSIGLIDTTWNPSDPRSTSVFLNPYQFVMTAKYSVNRNIFRMVNSCNSFTIQNDTQGTNIYLSGTLANGNPSRIQFLDDVATGFGTKFTTPSTLTQGLVVSSISINGANNLTASNGALYFNGSVVNASNTADIWAQFPATCNVNMNGYQMSNITAMKSSNYTTALNPGFFLDQTLGGVINGSTGLIVRASVDSYDSNILVAQAGSIEVQSGVIPHYVISSNGFAHQAPNATKWFKTLVNSNGLFTLNQMATLTTISTGTVFDTTFNKLPTFPLTYCTTPGLVRTATYSGPGLSVILAMGTFTPTTRQGIVSFQVIVPASYSNSQAWIGCGPASSGNYDDQFNVLIPPKDPYSGGYWNTITITGDFTNWVGSPFIFRMDGSFNGIFNFRNVQYKPLPN